MQYQVFSEEQTTQLNGKLDPRCVKTRKGSGNTTLAYIEGHTAIATANRIFGFGNWAFEPLSCEMVTLVDPVSCEPIGVTYRAKVQLTVRGCIAPIVEVGSQPVAAWSVAEVIRKRRAAAVKYGRRAQTGDYTPEEVSSAQSTIVEAHEAAEKGAVTDALKRCLRSFGAQFGNDLYGADRENTSVQQAS